MIELDKVVNKIRDDLKAKYLEDQTAVWEHPFVAFIKEDDLFIMEAAASEESLVAWLREFRGPQGIAGVVVGRMVAKFSQTIRDNNGNPQVLERAILVSGRILDGNKTYISITPCREHNDLRNPLGDSLANLEQKADRPYIPGLTSPDKVQKIMTEDGKFMGFKEMQFGEEAVFDSRKGDVCKLDPIIQGVLDTERFEKQV
jgi:hypothetical protein